MSEPPFVNPEGTVGAAALPIESGQSLVALVRDHDPGCREVLLKALRPDRLRDDRRPAVKRPTEQHLSGRTSAPPGDCGRGRTLEQDHLILAAAQPAGAISPAERRGGGDVHNVRPAILEHRRLVARGFAQATGQADRVADPLIRSGVHGPGVVPA